MRNNTPLMQLVVIIDDDPGIWAVAPKIVERHGGRAVLVKSLEGFWLAYAELEEFELLEAKFVLDGNLGDGKHGSDSMSAQIARFLVKEGHSDRLYRHSDHQLESELADTPELLGQGQIDKPSGGFFSFCQNGFEFEEDSKAAA